MAIIASVVVTPAVDDAEQGIVTAEFIPVADVPYEYVVADVTSPAITREYTYVSPVTSTEYISPVPNVSYAIPVTEVSYVEIATDVFIDDSGLFQIRFDISTVVDKAVFSLAKQVSSELVYTSEVTALTVAKIARDTTAPQDQIKLSFTTSTLDSVETSDIFSKVFTKSLADATAFSDSITGKVFSKLLRDTAATEDLVGVPDGATYQFCKYISDFPAVVEQLAKDVSTVLVDAYETQDLATLAVAKDFIDTLGAIDELSLSTGKALSSGTALVDALNYTLSALLQDSVAPQDFALFSTEKAIEDSTSAQDAQALQTGINKSDSVSISENKTLAIDTVLSDAQLIADAIQFALTTSYQDTLFVSDENSVYTHKTSSESVSTADSGLVVAQNYCDTSYFLEDYVGDHRQF